MTNKAIKLYLIPATACNWRLYELQLKQFPDAVVTQLLQPISLDETLQNYAQRLAKTIDTSTPFILVGVSLGGMLAQELALLLKPVAVIIIASCNNYKSISFPWQLIGKFIHRMPNIVIKIILNSVGYLANKINYRKFPNQKNYAKMLKEISPYLVRWQCGAATKWQLSKNLTMPVLHIHGARDLLMPIKKVQPHNIIANGGHLINITHARRVNGFIAKMLQA